jgi:hypothetical protein
VQLGPLASNLHFCGRVVRRRPATTATSDNIWNPWAVAIAQRCTEEPQAQTLPFSLDCICWNVWEPWIHSDSSCPHSTHFHHTFTRWAWPSPNGPRTTKTNKNGGLFHVKQHLRQSCGNISNSTCGGLSPYDCRSFLHHCAAQNEQETLWLWNFKRGAIVFGVAQVLLLGYIKLYVILEEVGDSFAKSWGKHSELHRPTSLINKSTSVNIFA